MIKATNRILVAFFMETLNIVEDIGNKEGRLMISEATYGVCFCISNRYVFWDCELAAPIWLTNSFQSRLPRCCSTF
ncbi:hypothetical protein KS4_28860 [Poriferisphaera corsica]|uniref:Uncharacterized protein n=1 Tax=Poriferisphaera corsica TaxID=2528020 RepID=A0A517YX61_9BACT|nr:hypothetical protein KS4_28860 [Poriferisphaera corsica]